MSIQSKIPIWREGFGGGHAKGSAAHCPDWATQRSVFCCRDSRLRQATICLDHVTHLRMDPLHKPFDLMTLLAINGPSGEQQGHPDTYRQWSNSSNQSRLPSHYFTVKQAQRFHSRHRLSQFFHRACGVALAGIQYPARANSHQTRRHHADCEPPRRSRLGTLSAPGACALDMI